MVIITSSVMSILETVKSWTLGPWVRRKEKKKVTVALWGSSHSTGSELFSHLLGTPGTYRRRISNPFEEVDSSSDSTSGISPNSYQKGNEESELGKRNCEESNGQSKSETGSEKEHDNGKKSQVPDDLLCGEDVFFDAMEEKVPLEGPDDAPSDVLYIVAPLYKDPSDPSSGNDLWSHMTTQFKDVFDEMSLMDDTPRQSKAVFVKRAKSSIRRNRKPISCIVKRSFSGLAIEININCTSLPLPLQEMRYYNLIGELVEFFFLYIVV